jgi:hypothetical protein
VKIINHNILSLLLSQAVLADFSTVQKRKTSTKDK